MKIQNNKQHGGFTLLEVMVALAIIAIALGATVRVIGNATSNTSYLVDKSFAQWIAMNEIAKVKIEAKWLDTGQQSGTAIMLEREWQWRREIKKTPDQDVRRIELSVFKNSVDEAPVATVTSFMAKPYTPQPQPVLR